jgi:deferrochelatase/peroxidase EfeB
MTRRLNLSDIQGNLLRGYGAEHARHFALAVTQPAAARSFIGELVTGKPRGPKITTAVEWPPDPKWKPPYCLNLGLTYGGLKMLGVDRETLEGFPPAFREGPAERAEAPDPDFPDDENMVGLGDTGDSAPTTWELGGPRNPEVHMMLSLYTFDKEEDKRRLEEISKRLRSRFRSAGVKEVDACDADALPDGVVHFGYRDGIAQPRIEGTGHTRRPEPPDRQPEAKAGDFLLGCGYENIYGGNYIGKLPPALADNATYAAFRILYQDVHRFELLLEEWGERYELDKEYIAAKLMGRWRAAPKEVKEKFEKERRREIENGTPLTLSPDAETLVDKEGFNDFDYTPTPEHLSTFDDHHGRRCPIGAHIRRLNPRSQMVIGMPHSRRLVRRGMPYGPHLDYQPGKPDDGQDRGLVGLFICGDLELQYEFILRVWTNMDLATQGLRATREPIVGAQHDDDGKFVIRVNDSRDPITLTGLPRLVETKGSVYCLVPGIGGLRYLASLGAPEPPAGGGGTSGTGQAKAKRSKSTRRRRGKAA